MNNYFFGLIMALAQIAKRSAEIKSKGLLTLLIVSSLSCDVYSQYFNKEVSISESSLKAKQEFTCKLTVANKIEELPNISVRVIVDTSTVYIVDNEGLEIKLDSIKIVPRMVENESSIVYLCSEAIFSMNWDESRDKYSFELNSKRSDGFPAVVEFFGCNYVILEDKNPIVK